MLESPYALHTITQMWVTDFECPVNLVGHMRVNPTDLQLDGQAGWHTDRLKLSLFKHNKQAHLHSPESQQWQLFHFCRWWRQSPQWRRSRPRCWCTWHLSVSRGCWRADRWAAWPQHCHTECGVRATVTEGPLTVTLNAEEVKSLRKDAQKPNCSTTLLRWYKSKPLFIFLWGKCSSVWNMRTLTLTLTFTHTLIPDLVVCAKTKECSFLLS